MNRQFIISIFVAMVYSAFLYNTSAAQDQPTVTPTPQADLPSSTVVSTNKKALPTPQKDLVVGELSNNVAEILQVPFTVPGDIGVDTAQAYAGLITIRVSGTGQSAGTDFNDAFYVYTDGEGNEISPPQYIEPFHLYINNAPAINIIGFLPEYRADHVYIFQIDVGSTPRHLNFAIGDLFTADNTGELTVEFLIETTPGCIGPTGLNICQLQKGDILLEDAIGPTNRNFAGFVGTYWFHSAIYDGEGNVLEAAGAMPDHFDDVRSSPIEESGFYNNANDWVVLRPKPEHQSKVDGAIEWARERADNPQVTFMPVLKWLNPLNKLQDDEFYCALFVWRAYKEQDLDLDADTLLFNSIFSISGSLLANKLLQQVLPDDLYASSLPLPRLPFQPTTIVQDKNSGFFRTLYILLSPADLRVIDAEGNITGINPDTGDIINNIPGAYYSGPESEPEWISVPNMNTTSIVEVYGTDTDTYTLGVQVFADQVISTDAFHYETQADQRDIFEISDPTIGPVDLQPVLLTILTDIKPGSDPNSINCNNKNEVIPVAILTTNTFDATTVDHATVTFEGAHETHVDKKSGQPIRHEEDVDGDGDIDLVFHFRLGDTSLTCDSTEGTLTGQTFEGLAIEGTDSIRMVPAQGTAAAAAGVEMPHTLYLPLVTKNE